MRNAWSRIKDLLRLTGGQQVVALPYFIGTLGLSFVLHFVGSTDLIRDDILLRAVVLFLSHLGAFTLIFCVNLFFAKTSADSRAMALSLSIPVAALIRALLIQAGMVLGNLSDGSFWVIRVASGTLLMATMMLLLSIVFGLFTQQAEQTALLVSDEQRLRELLDRTRSQVSRESTESAQLIREELLALLGSELDLSSAELSVRLRSVVEDGVRPLIKRILDETLEQKSEPPPLPVSKFQWASVLRNLRVADATVIAPLFIGVLALIPWDVRSGGAEFAVQSGIVKFALMLLSLGLGRLLAVRLFDQRNRGWNFVITPMLLIFLTIPYDIVLLIWNPYGMGIVMSYQAMAFVLIVGMIFSIWGSVRNELDRVIELRRVNNDRIRWQIAHLNGITWATKRNLARQLHGAVQSEIIAVLLRIAKNESDSNADPIDSKGLQKQLRSRLELILSTDAVRHDFVTVLGEIAETWEAVSSIDFHITDAATEAVARDPLASETAIEIIREGVSNAIRHGQAKQIRVQIGVVDAGDCLMIEIDSDGKSFEPGSREGLGTQQLRDCTVFYSTTGTAAGTKVSAAVPFDAEIGENVSGSP